VAYLLKTSPEISKQKVDVGLVTKTTRKAFQRIYLRNHEILGLRKDFGLG